MIRGYRLLLPGFLMLCVTAIGTAQDKISVKEGDTMPDITLPATSIGSVLPDAKDAKSLILSAFKGKKNVVLFFYPRAMTKGCTIESCGFRDTAAKFAKVDTVLIGISTDTVEKQQQFTDKEKLTYPLLADHEMKTTKALGILNGTAARRVTFVINKEGKVAKIYEKVTPASHPDEVLKFISENLKK